jgi:hypothetical protein
MYPLSLNRCLELCPASRSEKTDELVRNSFDNLVSKFKDNGQLIDADMDSIGIPTSMGIGKKPKEVLTISRQRAVWINHKKSVERLKITENLKNKAIVARKIRGKRKASLISNKIELQVAKEQRTSTRKRTPSYKGKERDDELERCFEENDEDYSDFEENEG